MYPIASIRRLQSGARWRRRLGVLAICLAAWCVGSVAAAEDEDRDLLSVVRGYADAMLDQSRYGSQSRLFPLVLTRDTFRIPDKNVKNLVTARVPQEFKYTANPHHHLNLYQVLYALTEITGEPRYGAEADQAMAHFLSNCQEPRYGFYCWGEHLGWDLRKNAPGGFPPDNASGAAIHEFYRPWIYWEKSFAMAPSSSLRFAQALWRHQVDHQGSISFSRHAMVLKGDDPSRRGYEFPRHGGFYIATWTAAYRATSDPEMLEAVEALVSFYESHRDPKTGAIPHGTGDIEYDRDGNPGLIVFTPSNLSLAVDLHDAASAMPDALQTRMRELAAGIDASVLALPHDPGPGGKGFVMFTRPDSIEPEEFWARPEDLASGRPPRRRPYTGGWRTAYIGQYPHTKLTSALIHRFDQTGNPKHQRLILLCADHYLTAAPDLTPPPRDPEDTSYRPHPDVEAGAIGEAMVLLNAAYRISGEAKYLDRAEWFASWALDRFWPDESPLPRASVRENVYSAPSRCDTLAMAMLQTWLLRNRPESDVELLSTDR